MEAKRFFYKAKVTAVHDGDTLTADIDLGFSINLKSIKIRLDGIDTPEITSKDAALKAKAILARDFLRQECLGKDVYLESRGLDKYGRCLAKVFTLANNCCNDMLVQSGLAISYDGGTKHPEAFIISPEKNNV
jgi:micrococcal nuclease